MRAVLLAQVASTLAMAGIIWFVQLVHYPLFARVPASAFVAYEVEHATRTGWLVAPLMCLELGTALLLLLSTLRPPIISVREAGLGLALVGVVWLSTGLVQVPLHNRLAEAYAESTIRSLIVTNWIRTLAWTARGALVLTWIARLMRSK